MLLRRRWVSVGCLCVALVALAGACSDPQPDPMTDACEKRCSEQAACCPLGGCAATSCVDDCVRRSRDERAQCRAEVDKYVGCMRSAPTWSCEQDATQSQGIGAVPDGCDVFPLTCCLNAKSAMPQVIAGCPTL